MSRFGQSKHHAVGATCLLTTRPTARSDKLKGPNVTIEAGLSISGTGSILGDSPILQDKGYFEVTIKTEGTFAVGVATKETAVSGVLSQDKVATAWTLTSSMQGLPPLPAGSTLGVALDQGDFPVQVYFYESGKVRAAAPPTRAHAASRTQRWAYACADGAAGRSRRRRARRRRRSQVVHQISGIRGEVLPAFSVANGAVLEPNFGGKPYAQGMPAGFQGIIKSMSLL